ncbi:MAG: hypothetical protein ABSC42_06160 [Tepidisphaeraceae bacterium]
MDSVRFFVHLGRFADSCPVVDRYRNRSSAHVRWLEGAAARRWLGCRPTAWLLRQPGLARGYVRRVAAAVCELLAGARSPRLLVCPQGLPSLLVIEELKRRIEFAYVTWVMDDHLVRLRNGGLGYESRQVERLMGEHLRGAAARLVISPAMADFYQSRFGCGSATLFGPCVSPGAPLIDAPSGAGPVRVAYFGVVGDWQLDALTAVAEGCARTGGALDVYTKSATLPAALRRGQVTARSPVGPEEVPTAMRTYDAVVLPISFSPTQRHLGELNIATKMSECLGSGTVTIVVGPAWSAMVSYLRDRGGAVIVTTSDSAAIADALGRVKDAAFRGETVRRAHELATGELSLATMRAVWNEAMIRLARSAA